MERELHLAGLLRVLDRHQVAYVMIGGLAAVTHGSPVPDSGPRHHAGVRTGQHRPAVRALTELGAKFRAEDSPDDLPFAHDADSLGAVHTWNLTTTYGDLDIRFVPSGTEGVEDLNVCAEPIEVDGVVVRVAGLPTSSARSRPRTAPRTSGVLPTLRELLARRPGKGEA